MISVCVSFIYLSSTQEWIISSNSGICVWSVWNLFIVLKWGHRHSLTTVFGYCLLIASDHQYRSHHVLVQDPVLSCSTTINHLFLVWCKYIMEVFLDLIYYYGCVFLFLNNAFTCVQVQCCFFQVPSSLLFVNLVVKQLSLRKILVNLTNNYNEFN